MTLRATESFNEPGGTSSLRSGQQSSTDTDMDQPANGEIMQEQQYRASAYSLIAALLHSPPDQDLLNHLASLSGASDQGGNQLVLSMSALGLSAGMHTPSSIEDEYNALFIGLGKGEVVPYASWYLTGFLMEKPLSDLRADLVRLGYQRNEEVKEPEDHAAALCEVMSMMIIEGDPLDMQREFFQAHIECWMDRFMNDLTTAGSAVFYKALGRFAAAFLAFEKEYFSMQV